MNTLYAEGGKIIQADTQSQQHLDELVRVVEEYKTDLKGNPVPFTETERNNLKEKFQSTSHVHCFLAYSPEGALAGGTICFTTFATFSAKKVLNIHDVSVIKDFQGKGYGKALIKHVIEYAKTIDCIKLTLEVNPDNTRAKNLYASLGFGDHKAGGMLFWENYL
jgi:ribosomal protein S18 acetylase RimI-like enzyme